MEKFYRGRSRPLPVGDVYAVPLADGRFGACRVIREPMVFSVPAEAKPNWRLVVACQYVGTDAPAADHPDVRRLLTASYGLFHGMPRKAVVGAWLSGPVPKGYVCVGSLEPIAADLAADVHNSVVWSAIPEAILSQWRWEHDRAAWLAEQEAEAAEFRTLQAEADRAKAKVTLASLQKQKLFVDWEGYAPKTMIAAARKEMKETAAKLDGLGPKPNRRKARAILRDCIVAFNKLDDENDHWIETTLREDICEVFYQLAQLAGFDDEPELADEWREF